eukprot:6490531-Amphidinium_carterae.1
MAFDQDGMNSALRSIGPRLVDTKGRIERNGVAWKFTFENYMGVLALEYTHELAFAAGEIAPLNINIGEAKTQQRNILLYSVLSSVATGKARTILMNLRSSRHGFEAWRRVCEEYEPSATDFSTGLMKWEQRIEDDDQFSETLKRAVLLKMAPDELARHLRLTGAAKSYIEMRSAIEMYLRARHIWNMHDRPAGSHQGPAPMDIGAIGNKGKDKGKEKGKDKGKSKGKDKGKDKKGGSGAGKGKEPAKERIGRAKEEGTSNATIAVATGISRVIVHRLLVCMR